MASLCRAAAGVDVLVANSGTGTSKLAVDLEYDEWRRGI
jgi:short-subunit dehydrogenase